MAENETPKRTKSWPVILYTMLSSGSLAFAVAHMAADNPSAGLVPALIGIGSAILAAVFAVYDALQS